MKKPKGDSPRKKKRIDYATVGLGIVMNEEDEDASEEGENAEAGPSGTQGSDP